LVAGRSNRSAQFHFLSTLAPQGLPDDNAPSLLFFAMTTTEWENIARCAHARHEALYREAMETGEKTFYGHRAFVTWGPLHDRAVRDLETCLMARLMASKYSNA